MSDASDPQSSIPEQHSDGPDLGGFGRTGRPADRSPTQAYARCGRLRHALAPERVLHRAAQLLPLFACGPPRHSCGVTFNLKCVTGQFRIPDHVLEPR